MAVSRHLAVVLWGGVSICIYIHTFFTHIVSTYIYQYLYKFVHTYLHLHALTYLSIYIHILICVLYIYIHIPHKSANKDIRKCLSSRRMNE